MVYILPVNMSILSGAFQGTDPPYSALYTSTALAAVLACLIMGLYANSPVALAPGMGPNIFLVNTICIAMRFTFYQALMTVFISGFLFFVVSVSGFRTKLMNAMPISIKAAITVGIGFLITVIGLFNSHIIVNGTTNPVLGDLGDPEVLLALFSVIVTILLFSLKWWGAVLIGMLSTCLLGILTGVISLESIETNGILNVPDFSLMGKFITDFGSIDINFLPSFIIAILSLFIVDLFDTTGSLLGLCHASGIADNDAEMGSMNKVMNSDSIGTMVGAATGTSTVTSYVESCTGIEAGAKTGFMAITVGLLFFVALFFATPFTLITSACTTGALISIGIIMMSSVVKIDWYDHIVASSAFLTIFAMGLSGSVSDGIGFGVISYCLAMIVTKRFREVSWFMYLLAVVFLLYFIFMRAFLPHL